MFRHYKRTISVIMVVCLMIVSGVIAIPASAAAVNNGFQFATPDFSYLKRDSNFTAAQKQAIAATLYNGIKNGDTSIKVTVSGKSFTTDLTKAVGNIYYEIVQNWDIGMTVKTDKGYSYSIGDDYCTIYPTYQTDSDAQIEAACKKLDEIVAEVDPDWTTAEKALFLHDYIAVNYDYDYYGLYEDNKHIDENGYYTPTDYQPVCVHSVYDFIKYVDSEAAGTVGMKSLNDEGVCDSYASLYSYLLNRLGVPCVKIISDAHNHAWNAVQISGKWYYVDITHDDSDHGDHPGLLRHVYFLQSSADMVNQRNSDGNNWTDSASWRTYDGTTGSTLGIASTSISGFWNGITTAIKPIGSDWVAIDGTEHTNQYGYTSGYDSNIRVYSDISSEGDLLIYETYTWFVSDSTSSYYPGTYMVPVYYDNILFLSTPTTVIGMYNNKPTVAPVEVASLNDQNINTSTYKIYGLEKKGDKLIYYYSKKPSAYYDSSNQCFDDPSAQVALSIDDMVAKVKAGKTDNDKWTARYHYSNGKTNYNDVIYLDGLSAVPEDPALTSSPSSVFGEICSGWAYNENGTELLDPKKVAFNDQDLYPVFTDYSVEGYSVGLTDNLNLNFYLDIDNSIANSDTYVEFSIEGDDNKQISRFDSNNKTDDGYYVFTAELLSTQMNSDIVPTLKTKYGSAPLFEGGKLDACITLSEVINDYYIENNAADDVTKKAAQSIADYCSMASDYFDGEIMDYDGEKYGFLEGITENDVSQYAGSVSGNPDNTGINYEGYSLVLESSIVLREYFTVPEAEVESVSMTIDGTAVSKNDIVIKGSDKGVSTCYVDIPGIEIESLSKQHTVTINGVTVKNSPLSYANRVIANNDDNRLVILMKSLVNYYNKAIAYKEAHQNAA